MVVVMAGDMAGLMKCGNAHLRSEDGGASSHKDGLGDSINMRGSK